MSISLLERWLAHYDPIHRGWTVAGIANGVSATNGFSFPRVRGGYNLRRVREGQAAEIVGAAGADASTIRTFPWVRHAADARDSYQLAAVNGGGVENLQESIATVVGFDGQGCWSGPRPNPPSDLHVAPVRGGRFLLRWVYSDEGQQVGPSEFRVYCGTGWSGVDYGSPVGTVGHRAGRMHGSWTSEPFVDGTRVTWAVRAVSPAGVEEDNERTAMGWADGLPPPINPTTIVRCVEESR